jgi:hypothetical protein
MSDVTGYSEPIPPKGAGQIVRGTEQSQRDNNQSNNQDPHNHNDEQNKKSEQHQNSDSERLDDQTRLSLQAIEARLFEELDVLLQRYHDQETMIDESTTINIPPAFKAYQKQAQTTQDHNTQTIKPFPPDHSEMTNEQKKRYHFLKERHQELIQLSQEGIESIPYDGTEDFLDAFFHYQNTI